jgi:hypothetical protein
MLLGTDFGNSPSDATFRLLRRLSVDASLPRSGTPSNIAAADLAAGQRAGGTRGFD